MAVIAAGDLGKPVLDFCGSLTAVMFKFAGIIMKFAPFGVGAAIAITVGAQGLGSLRTLGVLVLTLYAALVIFVIVVLGAVVWITRVPLKAFVRAVREPFTLAFATANSEAALPERRLKNMEKPWRAARDRWFCFCRRAIRLTWMVQHASDLAVGVGVCGASGGRPRLEFILASSSKITMMLILMLTSKGVAAVPRASFVVHWSLHWSHSNYPVAGAFLILGVDALLDMKARTSVNVPGQLAASRAWSSRGAGRGANLMTKREAYVEHSFGAPR